MAAIIVAVATVTAMMTKVAVWRGKVESRIEAMEKSLEASEARWEARMERVNEHVARLVKFMLESGRAKGIDLDDLKK